MLKIAPIVMDFVGKYTGKEKEASIFNSILSLSTLGDIFKDPKIGSELSKSTVDKLRLTDGSVMSRIVGMGKGGDLGKQSIFSRELGNSMQIGSSGLLGKYTSKLPGVQGLGKGNNTIFDPKFNVGQLGIQSPYNDTSATLTEWLK